MHEVNETYKAATRAEVLIEFLETDDDGHIQGGGTLFDRWDRLFRKYHNPEGMSFGCGLVSYEELREWI